MTKVVEVGGNRTASGPTGNFPSPLYFDSDLIKSCEPPNLIDLQQFHYNCETMELFSRSR